MTHNKFTELLNLYLDHEISLEDAAKLEAEIQQDPQRREIYRQYCRMQKGCTLMAESFGHQSESVTPRKISFDPVRTVNPFATWATGVGIAAAAGFAMVLMSNNPSETLVGEIATVQPAQPAALVASSNPEPAEALYSMPEFDRPQTELHTVFTPTLVNTAPDQTARSLYVNEQSERFDWMDRVDFNTPQDEDFSFQVRPAVANGQRTFQSQRPMEGRVEMTAFQFQR